MRVSLKEESITIRKVWQDDEDEKFFQILITASSDTITASTRVYSTSEMIDELLSKLSEFIDGNVNETLWENGEKGDGATAFLSLRFLRKNRLGHVLVEVYMELDDGGKFSEHHCCFYVSTELGLLEKFYRQLYFLKEPRLEREIVLNEVE